MLNGFFFWGGGGILLLVCFFPFFSLFRHEFPDSYIIKLRYLESYA